jgi:DNA (cytosine-5)-methyltransferase 1
MVDGPKGRAAWRILDAQFFGLAQRRKRVFIVFCPRNGGDPAAVLFEPASMSWHPPPSRTTREGTSPSIIKGASIGRKPENGPQCGQDERGVRNATVLLDIYNIAMPLRANDGSGNRQAFAIAQNQLGEVRVGDISNTLNTNANASGRNTALTLASSAVRRLTPRECERLQGFPDDYTLIPYRNGIAADGPRYKALGNSMAVPVMAWIGRRIAMVDDHS